MCTYRVHFVPCHYAFTDMCFEVYHFHQQKELKPRPKALLSRNEQGRTPELIWTKQAAGFFPNHSSRNSISEIVLHTFFSKKKWKLSNFPSTFLDFHEFYKQPFLLNQVLRKEKCCPLSLTVQVLAEVPPELIQAEPAVGMFGMDEILYMAEGILRARPPAEMPNTSAIVIVEVTIQVK